MAPSEDVGSGRATVHEFWAGAASGSSRRALATGQRLLDGARPSRIMINYQTKNSDRYSDWRDYALKVDPGAYSMFAPSPIGQGLADYPNSTETYIHDIGRMRPKRYAWRDYVCEDDVRDHHGWTVEDQQQKTTERHIECANLHEDLGITAEPMAVVQGWEPADYRDHAQSLVDHDLVTDRVGIGTMCGRNNVELCEDIVAAVREVLPGVKLHSFGLDKNAYASEYIINEIASTDSLAYCYKYKRPAGWSRSDFVLSKYMELRAAWDDAVGGTEYQRRDSPDRGQTTIGGETVVE